MKVMPGSMDGTWPDGRRSPWLAVVDITLPLAPVFWEVAEVAVQLFARVAARRRGLTVGSA